VEHLVDGHDRGAAVDGTSAIVAPPEMLDRPDEAERSIFPIRFGMALELAGIKSPP